MNFSQYAGTAMIPTLSRLVLCAVFVSAGYNKVFKDMEVDGAAAARLKLMGIDAKPQTEPKPETKSSVMMQQERHDNVQWQIVQASFRQETPSTQSQPAASSQTQPAATPTGTSITTPPSAPAVAPDVLPSGKISMGGKYTVLGVYALADGLEQAHVKYPTAMAWVAALTELIGGALLLVGLFSRIWGLGLSIAMGVAFYTVSMQVLHIHQIHPLDWAAMENHQAFSTAALQVALFVLAFGVMLTGPGPLSIDRMLFGGSRDEVEVEVVESKVENRK